MSASNVSILETETWSQSVSYNKKTNPSSSDSDEFMRVLYYLPRKWPRVYSLVSSPTESFEYDGDFTNLMADSIRHITECAGAIINEEMNLNARERNILLLNDLKFTHNFDENDSIPSIVIDNAINILYNIKIQPELYKTGEKSIQMQFESLNRSYLEFEVFEKRITCMFVPRREYDLAEFPDVSLDDMQGINGIIERYLDATGAC